MENRKPKIVIFAYNFPHKKTQDIIYLLKSLGIEIDCVLAADKRKLLFEPSKMRTSVKTKVFLEPMEICRNLGIPYFVVDHNSKECIEIIETRKCDFAIIAGARILKKEIIDCFDKGVLNLHPGMIPECRGLDAVKWSIYKNIPLGVTAHLIDSKIDGGKIVKRKKIKIEKDDTLFDFSSKIYDMELELLADIMAGFNGKLKTTEALIENTISNKPMDEEKERAVLDGIEEYKERMIYEQNRNLAEDRA